MPFLARAIPRPRSAGDDIPARPHAPYEGPACAVPPNPKLDRRISSAAAEVENLLAHDTRCYWLAWHFTDTIAADPRICRKRRTIQKHLRALRLAGRIEIDARHQRPLEAWVRLEGPRYGIGDHDIPGAFPRKNPNARAIILVARLTIQPGFTHRSLGSIPRMEIDDPPELDVHAGAPRVGTRTGLPGGVPGA